MAATGVISRDAELTAIAEFVDAVRGRPAALILEGEPGIGKTTLWQAAVWRSAENGIRVLSSRPSQSEAKLTFAGLADLLASVGESVLDELAPPQRRALEVALVRVDSGGEAPDRRAISTGFLSVLRSLSRTAPVVLAVDDVQWLDNPTWGVLEFAFRRLSEEHAGLVGTVRLDPDGTAPRSHTGLLTGGQVRTMRLGPLNLATLHQILRDGLGHSFTRPVLVKIEQASGGNPFFALELARAILDSGESAASSGRISVPDNLTALIQRRFRRLPSASRQALLVASAVSRPTLDLFDREAVARAEQAGMLRVEPTGRIAFTHPLIASSVYSTASVIDRREVHRALAERVGDSEERARHLALSIVGFSEPIANALEAAAVQARSRGAPAAAAELLELAIPLTPPDFEENSRRRALAAAEDHFHAGDLERSRMLAEQVEKASGPSPIRGHALRLLGEIRYEENSFAAAIPLFEQALEHLRDDPRAVWVHVNLAYSRVSIGDLPGAVAPANAAIEESIRFENYGLRAVALAVSAIVQWYLGVPYNSDRVEQALALEDPDLQTVMALRPSLIAGVMLAESDHVHRAAQILEALRLRTIERGEESELPLADVQLARVYTYLGQMSTAARYATEGYEISVQAGSLTMQTITLAERCHARTTAGDLSGAEADAAEARRIVEMTGYPLGELWSRASAGWLDLTRRNAAAALRWLEPIVLITEMRGFCDPVAAAWLPMGIEALVSTGEVDRAHALLEKIERFGDGRGRRDSARTAFCRGLVLAARGELGAALAAVDGGLTDLDRLPLPFALARMHLLKGQIHRRRKEKQPAREALSRSLMILEQLGSRSWAEIAAGELKRVGSGRHGTDELSPTEERVATLAASGLRNREIAQRVFLSPKTVEANLAHVYRKLGVRSRAELAARMGDRSKSAEM